MKARADLIRKAELSNYRGLKSTAQKHTRFYKKLGPEAGMVGSWVVFLYFRANSRPTVMCFLNLRFFTMGRFQTMHYWSLHSENECSLCI